jgi:hypothetical protein
MFPVAVSTVYVLLTDGRPAALELMRKACAEAYAFAPST